MNNVWGYSTSVELYSVLESLESDDVSLDLVVL